MYKVLAKLLARRLNPLLEKIVHEEQYGFVPKRHMSTCSYTILRLIDKIKQQNILPEDPAVLTIFLDIAAAFDTAKHSALSVLMSYLFPTSEFPDLVQNLTTRGLACVSINGLKSNYFLLSCGTGQGDPLSSPRFLILQHFFINALFKAINVPDMQITVPIPSIPIGIEKIPPILFADDSTMFLTFTSQREVDHWNNCLRILHISTGLKINPTKTKILPMKELTLQQSALAEQIGELTQEVEHLGVIIAVSPQRGRDSTYSQITNRFRNRVEKFTSLVSSSDIFHRKLLVQSLVSSMVLHIFRVYPATPALLSAMLRSTGEALWTYRFANEQHGRVKVAKKRWGSPLNAGGLNMVLPEEAALSSYISAMLGVFVHACSAPTCLLNKLYKITDNMYDIQLWGAGSIRRHREWLLQIFPGTENYFQKFLELLTEMETDPHVFQNTPVWGSQFAHDAGWQWTREEFEDLLPGVHTVYDLIEHSRFTKNTPVRIQAGLTLPGHLGREVRRLVERLNGFGLTAPPLPARGSRWQSQRPFLELALAFNRTKLFSSALKRVRRRRGDVIPPSYQTRVTGGQDVPRDIADFQAAYSFLTHATIESKLKSFQFELLNRTLYSVTKAFAMGHVDSYWCRSCTRKISDTSHAVTDCKIPTWFIKYFKRFARQHLKLSKYDLQETRFEFSIPSPTVVTTDTEHQIQHLFIAVKKLALDSQHVDRFPLWNNFVIYAKITHVAKTVLNVRRFAMCSHDILEAFVEFLFTLNDEALVGF